MTLNISNCIGNICISTKGIPDCHIYRCIYSFDDFNHCELNSLFTSILYYRFVDFFFVFHFSKSYCYCFSRMVLNYFILAWIIRFLGWMSRKYRNVVSCWNFSISPSRICEYQTNVTSSCECGSRMIWDSHLSRYSDCGYESCNGINYYLAC